MDGDATPAKKTKINLEWHKVDSHIGSRIYKNCAKPQGDAYSIRLNSQVDIWAGETRETVIQI